MSICSQQELPEQSISSLVYVHVESRQQLGRLTAPLHYNPCIYEDMWGEWECILVTFHANVISPAETRMHHLNEFIFFLQYKELHPVCCLVRAALFDPSWKRAHHVDVHVKVPSLPTSSLHLSGLLWRCIAQWKTSLKCWNDAARPGHFLGDTKLFWPSSTTAAHTQS